VITDQTPATWRDLQEGVARIFRDCGFDAAVEKPVNLVRGQAQVDVVATEDKLGRRTVIFCECKHWGAPIPQTVVHSFRTVVQDAGANHGYIVTSSRYQPGAIAAAELSNVRLLTWEEFQAEFQQQWIETFLLPEVERHLNPLISYCEPINSTVSRVVDSAPAAAQAEFRVLRDRFELFAMTMMMFTPSFLSAGFGPTPTLPLRRPDELPEDAEFPGRFFEATGYREWLADVIEFTSRALHEFRRTLGTEASEYL